MANLHMNKFVATQADVDSGVGQLDKEGIINALIAYKKQNPAKFEAKKEALYKKYGLDEIPKEVEDAVVADLEEKKKATKKLNIV
jgi:hypothetical protein